MAADNEGVINDIPSVAHITSTVYPISMGKINECDGLSPYNKLQVARIFTTPEEGNFTLGCLKLFHTRTRFILVVLVLLCLASVWSNIIAFNFVIVCMNNKEDITQTILNQSAQTPATESIIKSATTSITTATTTVTWNEEVHEPLFTPQERTYLTSALAAAALVANFPLVSLVNRFGIRFIFTILGVLSAFATCLLPMAINRGYYCSLGARILQGISFAGSFPVIGAFTSRWTYYKQNGLFVSILVAYLQLSPAITMPLSGVLCTSSLSWPSVCYAHGGVSLILFIIFAIFFRDSPEEHPFVNATERQKIAVGKSECSREEQSHIPYCHILKTSSVWAVWIAAIGNFTCVNMLFLYSPNYLHGALGMEMGGTGIAAAAPPLLQFILKLAAGFSSDKVRCLSETGKLRLYNSIAFFGCGIFLTILFFIPASHSYIAIACLGLAAGCLGFTTGGFFKAGPLLSKHFSPFVTGNVSLGITITMLIVPVMVWGLAPENDITGWQRVFLVTAGTLFITNIIFCLLCSAEPAIWTTDEFTRAKLQSRLASVSAKSSRNAGNQPN